MFIILFGPRLIKKDFFKIDRLLQTVLTIQKHQNILQKSIMGEKNTKLKLLLKFKYSNTFINSILFF